MSRTGWSNSDFLRIDSGIVTATPCTLAGWLNVPIHSAQVNAFGVYNSGDTTGNRNQFALLLTTGAQVGARTSGAAGGNTASTSTTFANGAWFHACGVFASATDRRAFLNGGGKATNASSQTPSGLNRVSVGCQDISAATSTIPNGSLGAEFAIWNIALSDADVANLAAGYSPKTVQPGNLVAYWPIIGDWSPEIELISGQGFSIQGSLAQGTHPPLPYYYVGSQSEMFHPGKGVHRQARFFQRPRSAGVVPGTGSISLTLADATLAAAAKLAIAGALSQTLANATLSSAATIKIIGALAVTLANATLSTAAELQIKAALAAALADVTLSSAAQLQIQTILAATLDDVTLASIAQSNIQGDLHMILEDAVLTATGNDGWARCGRVGGIWKNATPAAAIWAPLPDGSSAPWTKMR